MAAVVVLVVAVVEEEEGAEEVVAVSDVAVDEEGSIRKRSNSERGGDLYFFYQGLNPVNVFSENYNRFKLIIEPIKYVDIR